MDTLPSRSDIQFRSTRLYRQEEAKKRAEKELRDAELETIKKGLRAKFDNDTKTGCIGEWDFTVPSNWSSLEVEEFLREWKNIGCETGYNVVTGIGGITWYECNVKWYFEK